MRKYNIKAFTLIEVIVASAILSITVFWVYKLIWENAKLINNSNNYLQLNSLFSVFEECIKNKWYSNFLDNSTTKFNFWNNLIWCETDSSTWVIIDNIEYFLEAKIDYGNKKTDYIDFELKIEWEWVGIEKKDFRLYK
jgi:prepilin-type N-terminal cleavage/methylation domain-containing protein